MFPFPAEVPVDKSQMSQAVLVCTAHIHWDPEFCDVKLIQVSSNTWPACAGFMPALNDILSICSNK